MKKTHKQKINIAKKFLTLKKGTGKNKGYKVLNIPLFNNPKWDARKKSIVIRIERKIEKIKEAIKLKKEKEKSNVRG